VCSIVPEVKNAHLILLDPEQRASAVKIIEASIAEAHKEAKKLVCTHDCGVSVKLCLMVLFADRVCMF
jgi:hypothetical protein